MAKATQKTATPTRAKKDKPKTFLITGAAGFLGLHVARKFASKANHKLVLLDIAPYHEDEYPEGCVFVDGDVRDVELMDALLASHKPDVIVHGAAALPLWKPHDIYDINVRGTLNVLTAAERAGIKRVVFISSTAVYGVPDKHPLFEDDPMIGVGPYGETKIEGELLCETFRKHGLIVPIIRPKTFIGVERLGVFQILYDWIENGKRIPIIGDGNNRYQLLEVEDLAESIWLASSLDDDAVNDTFNIGATDFNTVREDVGAVCAYAGTGASPLGTPAAPIKAALRAFERVGLSPLYEWVYGTADKDSFVSVDKAREQLGWQPQYSNADALIRSYQWYIDNKHHIQQGTGVTHRIAWDQGILRVFKAFL
ncbi:MAG: NAD(P)-dependent oxidoreductase [Bradymonadaceae bacterium]|nr:NAD(P)-dependent oxidoreductase [Lujinxingiaceae bacterium]